MVANALTYSATPEYTGLADTTAWTADTIYLKFATANTELTIAVF